MHLTVPLPISKPIRLLPTSLAFSPLLLVAQPQFREDSAALHGAAEINICKWKWTLLQEVLLPIWELLNCLVYHTRCMLKPVVVVLPVQQVLPARQEQELPGPQVSRA